MWLIDVKTLKIREFGHSKTPPYAILSHTWGDDEVSFQDLNDAGGKRARAKADSYAKITGFCALVVAEGLQWAWVDTCCIDKTNSVELSEAINSMFQWYARSQICYAYLSDVTSQLVPHVDKYERKTMGRLLPGKIEEEKKEENDAGNHTEQEPSSQPAAQARKNANMSICTFAVDEASLEKSRWFTRGWTLQELLAPHDVVFVDQMWHEIGTKRTLEAVLERVTHISTAALADTSNDWNQYSVAQRFSWAAGRQTTRKEDEAYCLLGLLGVSMPLLYGEGRNAFARLQEEIIRRSDDQSIFAWSWSAAEQASNYHMGGVLAPSPLVFQDASAVTTEAIHFQPEKEDDGRDEVGDNGGNEDSDDDNDNNSENHKRSSHPVEPLMFLHQKMQTWMDAYLNPYEITRDVAVLRQPVLGPLDGLYMEPVPNTNIPQLHCVTAVQPDGFDEYYVSPSSTHPLLQKPPLGRVQASHSAFNQPLTPYRYASSTRPCTAGITLELSETGQVLATTHEVDIEETRHLGATCYPVQPIDDGTTIWKTPPPVTAGREGVLRRFTFRPAYLLPLLCTVEGRPLCQILTLPYVSDKGSTAIRSYSRHQRILQRVHMPSLVCLDPSLIHLLRPQGLVSSEDSTTIASSTLHAYTRLPHDQAVDRAIRTSTMTAHNLPPPYSLSQIKIIMNAPDAFFVRLDALVAAGYRVADLTQCDKEPTWLLDDNTHCVWVCRNSKSYPPHALLVAQNQPILLVRLCIDRPTVSFHTPMTDLSISLDNVSTQTCLRFKAVADMTSVSYTEMTGPDGCVIVVQRRQAAKPSLTLLLRRHNGKEEENSKLSP